MKDSPTQRNPSRWVPTRWSPGAFASRSFRRYTYGNAVSWTGDWMDLTVLNWAVLQISGSAYHLGAINACRLLPVFALSFAGWIDR